MLRGPEGESVPQAVVGNVKVTRNATVRGLEDYDDVAPKEPRARRRGCNH